MDKSVQMRIASVCVQELESLYVWYVWFRNCAHLSTINHESCVQSKVLAGPSVGPSVGHTCQSSAVFASPLLQKCRARLSTRTQLRFPCIRPCLLQTAGINWFNSYMKYLNRQGPRLRTRRQNRICQFPGTISSQGIIKDKLLPNVIGYIQVFTRLARD